MGSKWGIRLTDIFASTNEILGVSTLRTPKPPIAHSFRVWVHGGSDPIKFSVLVLGIGISLELTPEIFENLRSNYPHSLPWLGIALIRMGLLLGLWSSRGHRP